MVSKISFYILTEESLKARDLYACRIIEKAYNNKHKIYVHTSSAEEADTFDTQLWTFRDISFVPHELYIQNSQTLPPVLIGYNNEIQIQQPDILINLAPEIPQFYEQFNRIIEIIPNDKHLKASARKKYQSYKNQGLQIETFNC